MSKANAKQKRFVKEYLLDLNATRAYIAAGYSEKGASASAYKLLRNAKVVAIIQEKQAKRSSELEISAGMVLAELKKLAFSNMLDYIAVQDDGTAYVNLKNLTRDQAAAIQEINTEEFTIQGDDEPRVVTKVKFKLSDKKASLELLGRHLGLFEEAERRDKGVQIIINGNKVGVFPVSEAGRLSQLES